MHMVMQQLAFYMVCQQPITVEKRADENLYSLAEELNTRTSQGALWLFVFGPGKVSAKELHR